MLQDVARCSICRYWVGHCAYMNLVEGRQSRIKLGATKGECFVFDPLEEGEIDVIKPKRRKSIHPCAPRIKELVLEGLSDMEIAEELGYAKASIKKMRLDAHIRRNPEIEERIFRLFDKRTGNLLHCGPLKECAKSVNRSYGTLNAIVKGYRNSRRYRLEYVETITRRLSYVEDK